MNIYEQFLMALLKYNTLVSAWRQKEFKDYQGCMSDVMPEFIEDVLGAAAQEANGGWAVMGAERSDSGSVEAYGYTKRVWGVGVFKNVALVNAFEASVNDWAKALEEEEKAKVAEDKTAKPMQDDDTFDIPF